MTHSHIARLFRRAVVVPLLVVWCLLLPGCLEHEITTTIHEDGSCDRSITLPADSMLIPFSPFPLPALTGWDTTWRPAPKGSGLAFAMKRHFATYQECAAQFAEPSAAEKLRISFSVEKQFRWFYSYFVYREVYHRLTPFTLVAPESVLTADEIARYAAGERTDSLNHKVEEWMARNLFEQLHHGLRDAVARLGDPALSVATIDEHKEALYAKLFQTTPDGRFRELTDILGEGETHEQSAQLMVNGQLSEKGLTAFLQLVATIEHNAAILKLHDAMREAWDLWAATVQKSIRMQGGFVNAVTFPGVIVASNALQIEGNTLTWKFDGEQYALGDYVMSAESRLENLWAFIVTAIAALLVAVRAVMVGRKQKEQK
jgi:hypothetical protein